MAALPLGLHRVAALTERYTLGKLLYLGVRFVSKPVSRVLKVRPPPLETAVINDVLTLTHS